MLKNSEMMSVVPYHLRDLLTRYSNKDFQSKLVSINTDFLDKYKYYKKTQTPEELSNFLLHSIADILISILHIFQKHKIEKMGTEYINILISNILGFEKKLTSFRVTKTKIKQTMEDDAVNTEEQKIAEFDENDQPDVSQDLEYEEEIIDEEPEDPFSLGDLDVEMDGMDDDDSIVKDVADKL